MESSRRMTVEILLTVLIAALVLVIAWGLVNPNVPRPVPIIAIVALVLIGYAIMRFVVNPKRMRGIQADRTLQLAKNTLAAIHDGLNSNSADEVCKLLLPYSSALAVAVTDTEQIIGYAGFGKERQPNGTPITVRSTVQTLEDGETRVLTDPMEIGFPDLAEELRAAIVTPLRTGSKIVGTLKFYYRSSRKLDITQQSLDVGLAQLLSTQLTAGEVDKQTELATRMELRALQAQINPHFLFNTINTIASLIRTDPAQARDLLRQFAVFYRGTLENSRDTINLSAEIEQTDRYFALVRARFGEDRLDLRTTIEPGLEYLQVPAFIVQPIVENAVNHAMRDEGQLHIVVLAKRVPDGAVIIVEDDGVGIPEEKLASLFDPKTGSPVEPSSDSGMGIAMKNVDDRLKGLFGPGSGITMTSVFGEGTTVYLHLNEASN